MKLEVPTAVGILITGLSLIFIPFYPGLNKPLRWGLLVGLAVTIILFAAERRILVRNFLKLLSFYKILLIVLSAGMIASTLLGNHSPSVRMIGWGSEFLGILSWLAFLVVAIFSRAYITSFLQTFYAVILGTVILAISLISNFEILLYGFRITGLLQQATSMGMYSVFVLLLSIWHLVYRKYKLKYRVILYGSTATSLAIVLLSQSRLALMSALLVIFVISCAKYAKDRQLQVALIIPFILLLITPIIARSYFNRLGSEALGEGISYRGDVYRASFDDIKSSNYLLGYGASGVPETINSRDLAPEGLQESLDTGFIFLSAHDIFLDVALSFGALAGMALLLMAMSGLFQALLIWHTPSELLLGLSYGVFLFNGVFNVPSLEMTLLFFVMLLAILPNRKFS